ncbi:TrbI/VirB10 family protein [Novosphingobium terrae]|uniref:TrbI/VirB10 family protein n=1 Tax=Novosphingobium terrae TaxID=2726189 RepID=UPI0019816D2A|nr:TrbI/VirB10 family protein [Novosphingobium terrae]
MSEAKSASPAPADKIDPETLVLRAQPHRVVRFKKQAIIALACVGTIGIGAIGYQALKSPASQLAGKDDGQVQATKAPADALSGAPKTYGDVPQLGPPLPGDLGKPILDHQQGLGGTPAFASPTSADQAALTARQNLEAQRKSARESGVMVQIAGVQRSSVPAQPAATDMGASLQEVAAAPVGPAKMALDPDHDPGGQQRKADFVASKDTSGDINPHMLSPPVSPYTLSAGTVLAASLITGLNSDLPGLVTAQITENAYDSASGHYLLIPQGSRLIGSYDSVVAYGQKRALVIWQRIILPDGSSVRIDNVPASDTAGYAGLADKVDVHTWQLLKGVALSTMLGVSAQLSFGSNESDLLRALRESTQQSVSRAGDQIVSHALNVQPTITVRPGWPLRVVVHKDIVLPQPWGSGRRP